MSKTMRRTPIIFDYGFSGTYGEHDYTNDWARIGVYWSEFNTNQKSILPIYDLYFGRVFMPVYEEKEDNWFLHNDLIERITFPGSDADNDTDIDISHAAFKNTKCLKEIFYDSSAKIEVIKHLHLHQEFFDLETWLLENLNGKFQFIATLQTDRIITEERNEDGGQFTELVDGFSNLSLNLSINFHDDTDAMAYKLAWE